MKRLTWIAGTAPKRDAAAGLMTMEPKAKKAVVGLATAVSVASAAVARRTATALVCAAGAVACAAARMAVCAAARRAVCAAARRAVCAAARRAVCATARRAVCAAARRAAIRRAATVKAWMMAVVTRAALKARKAAVEVGARMTTKATAAVTVAMMVGCTGQLKSGNFTSDEIGIIREASYAREGTTQDCGYPAGTMRVLTIKDHEDSLVLRARSNNLSARALLSEEYSELECLMVATVTHPTQDGVGIAGPQVGLNRRVVAVQRFDKAGEPFEVYPNIRIVWKSDSLAPGPEGCLSVPDRRGEVLRSKEIVIEYADMDALKRLAADGLSDCLSTDDRDTPSSNSFKACDVDYRETCSENNKKTHAGDAKKIKIHLRKLKASDIPMCRDTIKGFTAVIFQHETDHLDGILYTDREQIR